MQSFECKTDGFYLSLVTFGQIKVLNDTKFRRKLKTETFAGDYKSLLKNSAIVDKLETYYKIIAKATACYVKSCKNKKSYRLCETKIFIILKNENFTKK